MIEEYEDFWKTKCDARAITTNGTLRRNGNAIMGAGVALQARNKCLKRRINLEYILGNLIAQYGNHVFYIGNNLYSFPTKLHWRDNSDINLIKRSATELVKLIDNTAYKRVLMTRPGCGNGRLDWKDVKPAVQNILDNRFIITY